MLVAKRLQWVDAFRIKHTLASQNPPMAASGFHVFLFAYGSLMAASSRMESLPDYDNARFPPRPVKLHNYRKAFSAIYANNTGFVTAEGIESTWVAYLNVEPDPGACALGVLLPLSLDQFRRLEARESGYHAVDVSRSIESVDGAILPPERVLTFCFPVGPMHDEQGSAGQIGIGADYQRIVARACAEIDVQLGGSRCSSEFAQICDNYARWPQLVRSNPRTAGEYR